MADWKTNPNSLVGERIKVLWSKGKKYEGLVTKYCPVTGKHQVEYDDGDVKLYNMELKTFWLDNGIEFDFREPLKSLGESLWYACQFGDVALVRETLMDAGDKARNLMNFTYGTWTPLLQAAYNGYSAVVEVLLAKGASVAATSSAQNTALHYAAYRGHKETVEVLLRAGADPTLKNISGRTASEEAKLKGHSGIKQMLEQAVAGHQARQAAEQAQKQAEDKAKKEAEEQAKEAEEKAKKEAEEKAKKAAESPNSDAVASLQSHLKDVEEENKSLKEIVKKAQQELAQSPNPDSVTKMQSHVKDVEEENKSLKEMAEKAQQEAQSLKDSLQAAVLELASAKQQAEASSKKAKELKDLLDTAVAQHGAEELNKEKTAEQTTLWVEELERSLEEAEARVKEVQEELQAEKIKYNDLNDFNLNVETQDESNALVALKQIVQAQSGLLLSHIDEYIEQEQVKELLRKKTVEEIEGLNLEKQALQATITRQSEKAQEMREELDDSMQALDAMQKSLDDSHHALDEMKQSLDDSHRKSETMSSRVQELEELLKTAESTIKSLEEGKKEISRKEMQLEECNLQMSEMTKQLEGLNEKVLQIPEMENQLKRLNEKLIEKDDIFKAIPGLTDKDKLVSFSHHKLLALEQLLEKTVARVKEMKIEVEKKSNKDSSCVVCLEAEKTVLVLPCKHLCLCVKCSELCRDNCPMCRSAIHDKMNIYTS